MSPDSGLDPTKVSMIDIQRNMGFLTSMYKKYKYRGFYKIQSDYMDYILKHSLEIYSENVYNLLAKRVEYINRVSLGLEPYKGIIEGFFEYNKSTLLKITRIAKTSSNTDDEDKGSISSGHSMNNDSKTEPGIALKGRGYSIKSVVSRPSLTRVEHLEGFRSFSTYRMLNSGDSNSNSNSSSSIPGKTTTRIENDLLNTRLSIELSYIMDLDITDRDKQLKLEDCIKDLYENLFMDSIKNGVGFKSSDGLGFLLDNVKMLISTIDTLKVSKNYLKHKRYSKYFIRTPSDIIISIVLTNIIPHCLRYDEVAGQKVTGLYAKIGKQLINSFLNYEYKLYKDWFKQKRNKENLEAMYSVEIDGTIIRVERGLYFTNLVSRLGLTELIDDEDQFRYASDMVEFISMQSTIYHTDVVYDFESQKSKRVLFLDKGVSVKLLDTLSYDTHTFPMISQPNE